MRQPTNTLALGQAGVHRVCAELLLRGLSCYLPTVDVGADIQLGDGRKLQVKATRLRAVRSKGRGDTPSLGPAYRFSMSRQFTGNFYQGAWRRNATARPHQLRKFSEDADFVVLWGVDEDRFWIVPAALLDLRQGLVLYPGRRVPQTSRNGMNGAPLASVVFAYEDRWDLLDPSAVTKELPVGSVGVA